MNDGGENISLQKEMIADLKHFSNKFPDWRDRNACKILLGRLENLGMKQEDIISAITNTDTSSDNS